MTSCALVGVLRHTAACVRRGLLQLASAELLLGHTMRCAETLPVSGFCLWFIQGLINSSVVALCWFLPHGLQILLSVNVDSVESYHSCLRGGWEDALNW